LRKKDSEALRGRILLVYQDSWRTYLALRLMGITNPWLLSVSKVARELGVSRQRVYRSCPELRGRV